MSLRFIYRLLAILACFSILLWGANYFYFYYQEKPETGILSMLPQVQNQTRLLVIAPHCDDETLGCGGIIQGVLAAGGEVMVVIMTNGDGFTFAAREQFHIKEQVLNEYISQLRVPIMSNLLHSFIRQNELFEEVLIPVAEQKTSDLVLFSTDAWLDREATDFIFVSMMLHFKFVSFLCSNFMGIS